MRSMFGEFNPVIDELGHLVISILIVVFLNQLFQLSKTESIVLVLIGLLIDIDHFLNPLIGRVFGIKATVIPSKEQQGHTVKALHGIDLFVVYSILILWMTNDIVLSLGVLLVLVAHHLWDFIVYDHTWRELFLVTRLRCRFNPGRRKRFVGVIFDQTTLPR